MPHQEAGFPAISIRQPWADLIMLGLKDIENRSRKTNFRGKILIHASRIYEGDDGLEEKDRLALRIACSGDDGEYAPVGGYILGMAEITDCVTDHRSRWFSGPYGWVIKKPVPFDEFIDFKGKVGVFYVPMSLLQGTPAEKAVPGAA